MSTKKLLLITLSLLVVVTFIVSCNRNAVPTTTEAFTPEIQPLPKQLETYEPMVIP